MEPQSLINLGIGAFCAGAGFIIRALWDAVTSLRADLGALQKNMGDTYVRRDDFKEHAGRVLELLDRIYEKLDTKADRAGCPPTGAHQ